MLKPRWRDGAFSHCGQGLRLGFNSVLEKAATVAALIAIVISLMRADDFDARTDQVHPEHVFGFNEGADFGSKGEREVVVDSTLRASRSTGASADMASQFQFGYIALQNLRISGATTLGYYDIDEVSGIEDARRAVIQSQSFDARFGMPDPFQAPFGLTLSVAPHWGLVDETSGVRTDQFGAEIQMLAFEPKFDLPSEGDEEMHEVRLSNVLIGAGCLSVLAGLLQLFCQALEVRPAKRGRIRTALNFGKWSLRSTAPGVIMIAIGVVLLGSLSVQ